jgi:hypothetical protein
VRACPALSNTGEAFVNTALRTRAAQQRAEHAPESAQQSGHIVRRCVMQRFSDDQHPHRGGANRRQDDLTGVGPLVLAAASCPVSFLTGPPAGKGVSKPFQLCRRIKHGH